MKVLAIANKFNIFFTNVGDKNIYGIKIHNLKLKSPNHDNAFSCNCIHIKSADSTKYLGVTIDK